MRHRRREGFDRLDNDRRRAILILEFFDRLGITIRRGDLRRVMPVRLRQFGPVAPPPAEMLACRVPIGKDHSYQRVGVVTVG